MGKFVKRYVHWRWSLHQLATFRKVPVSGVLLVKISPVLGACKSIGQLGDDLDVSGIPGIAFLHFSTTVQDCLYGQSASEVAPHE